jgi:HK97 gp10 family phage protein
MDVKLISHRAEVESATQQATDRALEIIGGKAESYAKQLCAVDTGLLRNSITHARAGQTAAIDSYTASRGGKTGVYNGTAPAGGDNTVYIGSNVEYAPYVELGTHRTAAKPFLRPAAENHGEEYKQVIISEYKKAGL